MTYYKKRSRSETRKLENIDKLYVEQVPTKVREEIQLEKVRNLQSKINNTDTHPHTNTSSYFERRKTSAELISEAKTFLADVTPNANINHPTIMGGVRLINTRRPITPREPGRALYGKVALAGRPPSSFSLRYLQGEGNRKPKTPPLEPIKKQIYNEANKNESGLTHNQRKSRRSQSFDSRFEFLELPSSGNGGNGNILGVPTKQVPRMLPALEIKGEPMGGDNKKLDMDKKRNRSKTAKPVINSDIENIDVDLNKNSKTVNALTTRKLFTRSYDLLAQSPTEKLVELLKEHAGLKDCTEETVNHINSILVELYSRVRKSEKGFKRGFILGGLYGLVECSSPKILLSIARVVLALRVTGSNLTGACKLIFKVARNEQNDQLFHENDLLELLIDGLGRASPLDDPEACIYGYGSIRFLTSSSDQERAEASNIKDINKNSFENLKLPRKPATAPAPNSNTNIFEVLQQEKLQKLSKQNTLVERLARHGAVELMVLHLQILNEAGATQKLTGPPLHSLYQLSAALRTLADVRQTSSSIEKDINEDCKATVESSVQLEMACPHLIRAAEVSIGELEVQANIVRTLSVLSEDNDCCHVLVNFTARLGMLLGPCCEIFSGSTEKLLSLLSRLGYILGNIMAKYDNARVQFYHNDVAMEYLLNVLELYSKEPLTLHNSMGDTVIDVLIKIVRVVANMSVNSEVGFGLGNTRTLGDLLLNLFDSTNQMKSVKLKCELLELAHATLGSLHNLCFYQDKIVTPTQVVEAKGSLQSKLSDLATTLCHTLKTSSEESTKVETARVLGNLTRNEKARKYFCKAGGLSVVAKILLCNANVEYDLKACTTGILVNLLGDAENRTPFIQMKGAELLMELLKTTLQQDDWFLANIICQAFWNLLIDTANIKDIYQEQTLDDICDLLVDYLDEDRISSGTTISDTSWEDFAIVATDLLERLQASYGNQTDHTTVLGRVDKENSDDEDDVYIEEM